MGTDKVIDDLTKEVFEEMLGDLEADEIRSRKIAELENRFVRLADQVTKLVDGVSALTNIVASLVNDSETTSKLTGALVDSAKQIADVCTMHASMIKNLENRINRLESAAGITHD